MVVDSNKYSIEYANKLKSLMKLINKNKGKKYVKNYLAFMEEEYRHAFEASIKGRRVVLLQKLLQEINYCYDLMKGAHDFFVSAHGYHDKHGVSGNISLILNKLDKSKSIIESLIEQSNLVMGDGLSTSRLELLNGLFTFCQGFTSQDVIELSREASAEHERITSSHY